MARIPTTEMSLDEQVEHLTAGADMGDESLLEAMKAELRKLLEKSDRPLRIYLGLDPTSPHVHLGHAVVMTILQRFQELGHQVVFLVGDFTARIGDPTGRSKTRPPLTEEEIAFNATTYTDQAFRLLDEEKTEVRHNSEWLGKLDFATLLTDCAGLTLAQLLIRDDFRQRHEAGTPIHLHEFMYALAQGIDACELETDVQIGGRDQLFNILAGRDVMRHRELRPQVCLTFPLLVGTDGKQKMSKSYGNDIGVTLDAADMYGKVMSIPDEAMADYYRLASGLPPTEAAAACAALESGELHPREGKAKLARCVVERWHDADAAAAAEESFLSQFRDKGLPTDVPELVVPTDAATVLDLVAAGGGSRSDAKRLVQGGGVSLDGEKLADWRAELSTLGDLDGRVLKLGKRRVHQLKVDSN
ncbi:MAG: tyrosine--tRNA ligase [Acidobacteriota bacterium]